MSTHNLVSTSKLAKIRNIEPKLVFTSFSDSGYMTRTDDQWVLTKQGEKAGGSYRDDKKHGKHIVWPVDIKIPDNATSIDRSDTANPSTVSSTELGKKFKLSAQKVNHILSELGWLKKSLKGWQITESGLRVGGIQKESFRSGVPYVVWPDAIVSNKVLFKSINEVLGDQSVEASKPVENSFRDKFEAKHRCSDGHMVRSRAEMLIDNWLYMAEITHAYERRLPIEKEVYCDFYIPSGKVYIEFWGLEDNPKYAKRKEEKLNIYKHYNFNLIELTDNEVLNLDDYLPKLLLKFGIQAY